MKTITSSALFLLLGLFSACGPQPSANPCSADGGVCDLATCQPGQSVAGTAEAPGANCTYGGVKYISASGTSYVCTGALGPTGISGAAGAQGPTGITGAAGTNGQSPVGSTEAAGANCARGGLKYTTATGVGYVCDGPQGTVGANGAAGSIGLTGLTGPTGGAGTAGVSVVGASEALGANCARGGVKYTTAAGFNYVCNGLVGPNGSTGPTGSTGLIGPTGPAGTSTGTMTFGYFYALMPGDNVAPIAAAVAVAFPQSGAANGISRFSPNQFTLSAIGTYEISWQVSVAEAGQLVLGLDSGAGVIELADTVAGRNTGASQITNHVLVATTVANSILTVQNPTGNSTALTITPVAGGTHSVSASLVIKQIK